MENNERQQFEAMVREVMGQKRYVPEYILDLMQKAYDMPRWIACSERLPEDSGYYLTWVNGFSRSMIYKKRIAPKGHVFIVATYKDMKFGDVYTMMNLVYTAGMTDQEEADIKEKLAINLKSHFKL